MANIEETGWCSYSNEEEETKSALETTREDVTQTFEEGRAVAPSVGDGRFCLVVSSCHDKEMMDDKISPIAKQLQYLLNKADELQAQLMWSSDCCQNDEFANVIPMFLQTCQPYFTYLESTARNSHPLRPPLSTYIRTQLLWFSQQLCSRLEQLVMMFASFSIFSVDETDPMSISHFFIGQCQIDNMKLSIFRYCYPTPFLASANSGLYKRMRWNVERETERFSSTEFYFLCCEDVLEEMEDDEEKAEKQSRVTRIWSVGQWIQTYPNTDDIMDWVLCSVPCGQYKLLLCLGSEEPLPCAATDCLLGVLLSDETYGTAVTET